MPQSYLLRLEEGCSRVCDQTFVRVQRIFWGGGFRISCPHKPGIRETNRISEINIVSAKRRLLGSDPQTDLAIAKLFTQRENMRGHS